MRTAWVVLRKDLRVESRTLETLPAMILLALVTFVIFHFGLNRDTISGQEAAGTVVAIGADVTTVTGLDNQADYLDGPSSVAHRVSPQPVSAPATAKVPTPPAASPQASFACSRWWGRSSDWPFFRRRRRRR